MANMYSQKYYCQAYLNQRIRDLKHELHDLTWKLNTISNCSCGSPICDNCEQIFKELPSDAPDFVIPFPELDNMGTEKVNHPEKLNHSEALVCSSTVQYSGETSTLRSHNSPILRCSDDIRTIIKKGYLLLFAMVNFDGAATAKFTSHSDMEMVKRFFQNSAGFTVVECVDFKANEVREKCRKMSYDKDLENCDCLAVVILSHGNDQGIFGTDKRTFTVDEVVGYFQGDVCQFLAGKPKLFFLEACRGDGIDPGVLVRGADVQPDNPHLSQAPPLTVSTFADNLVVYATAKGMVSHGYEYLSQSNHSVDVNAGSWFITTLIDIFQRHSKREDILKMLTRVNNIITHCGDDLGRKQITNHMSSLRHTLYFNV